MKRLILIGPGHAHLRAIRDALLRPTYGWEVLLIAPGPIQVYSGMVPGFLAGQYRLPQLSIDVPALCRSRGVFFHQGWVESVDLAQQQIRMGTGEVLGFDLVSMNLGGLAAADDVPGARDHAVFLRPITTRQLGILMSGTGPIVVVGGGVGSVEVACCLQARSGRHTTLVSAARAVPIGSTRAMRRAVWEAIKDRQMAFWLRNRVVSVHPEDVELSTGNRIPYGQLIWVTESRAPPLPSSSGAKVDERGYLLVRDTLQSVSHPFVFGAGDAITFEGESHLARDGAHAVREGRVLGTNLRAAMENRRITERYVASEAHFSFVNLGDGTAIASRGNRVLRGRSAFWLKDAIDRKWLRSLRG